MNVYFYQFLCFTMLPSITFAKLNDQIDSQKKQNQKKIPHTHWHRDVLDQNAIIGKIKSKNKPFLAKYNFGWKNIIKAGEVTISLNKKNNNYWENKIIGKSTGIVRAFWKFKIQTESMIDNKTIRPIQDQILLLEKYENTTIKNNYRSNLVISNVSISNTAINNKDEHIKYYKFDFINSLPSTVMLLQNIDLKLNTKVSLVIWPQDNPYLISITPQKKEIRKYKIGKIKTIKIHIKVIKIKRKNHQLMTYKKAKQNYIWISDDANRIPLEIKSKVFIGNITGKIQSLTL